MFSEPIFCDDLNDRAVMDSVIPRRSLGDLFISDDIRRRKVCYIVGSEGS